uniref:Swan n=1 Tax=Ciona intestinalis TaxID=7719 RepID=Q6XLI4_CIOIN|nr:swan [Ciona intestinalis]AAP48572.1 swan [Ciona intestinalis]|eukprot:NP_001027771.1 swan [Ciona intestinalis]
MATGVVIRLKHLPLAAGTFDIRQFFSGLRIPDGGVHIIGGTDGTAFILFSTDEDARQAMMRDGQHVRATAIKLMLSSHTEMKTVIEHSQRISAIRFMLDEKGRNNGTCLIKFKTVVDKEDALQKDRKYLGGRFIRITTSSERQWLLVSTQSCETIRPGESRKRSKTITSSENTPKRSRALSPLKNENCVEVRGLPQNADYHIMSGFFSGLNIVDGGLFIENDGKICKGRAFVEFAAYADYKNALVRDGDMIDGKQVRVIGLSRQNMIDQIRKFKKYMSAKREEEYKREREREKKLEQKRVKEEEDRKKKMERHARKQKEMDEWLRRQHQKEEEQRKRRDLEKKMFQFANTEFPPKVEHSSPSPASYTEEHKAKEDYVPEEYNPEEYVPEEYIPEEYVPQPSSTKDYVYPPVGKDEKLEYAPEENAAGVGEMDIEEDNSPPANVSTSQSSISSVPPSIPTPTPTRFGGSGSVIESPALGPVKFDPAVPPPPLPFPSQIPSSFQPISAQPPIASNKVPVHPLLPPLMPPNHTLQAAGFPPPFPAGLPVIPVSITKPNQTVEMIPANIKTNAPPPSLPPPPASSTTPLSAPPSQSPENVIQQNASPMSAKLSPVKKQSNEPQKSVSDIKQSCLVRIANSPFNCTEEAVRKFFSDFSIPHDGIQFVYKGGRRSGHIFVKFSNADDAVKAALRDNQRMMGRNVLVGQSSVAQMKEIHHRISGEHWFPQFSVTPDIKEQGLLSKKIKENNLTCVCIGNLHSRTITSDVKNCLLNHELSEDGVTVLMDKSGLCIGEACVELRSTEDCIRATDLDSNVKILNNSIQVWPLSKQEMLDKIKNHNQKVKDTISGNHLNGAGRADTSKKMNAPMPMDIQREINKVTDYPLHPPHGPQQPPPIDPHRPPGGLPPFDRHPYDRPPLGLPHFDRPPPDLFDRHRQFGPGLPLPPLSPLDRRPHYPPNDRLFLPELLRRDLPPHPVPEPFMFPPHHNGPPLPGRGIPVNPNQIVTVKMSNLSYDITREDLLEFFSGFDPLPDSVQLMYSQGGKPTGDGVISFPHIEPARAAIAQRHNKFLLHRNVKLKLQ